MPASSLLGARVGTDAALIVRRPWLCHLRGLVLPLAVLVLLEALVRLDWIPAHQLPAPSQVGQTLWWLAAGGGCGGISASAWRGSPPASPSARRWPC